METSSNHAVHPSKLQCWVQFFTKLIGVPTTTKLLFNSLIDTQTDCMRNSLLLMKFTQTMVFQT